ncbi:MliC family protein [Sphingopyxis sp.]|uniref:MliC family protein n=1 Tax=Sphingopyxis sp. TaxID=1908224 RepID=UPI002B49EF2B|nr:MliC family protein [Sphingopyxis sp.]HJS11313.1 MliC family protein [Sphingopyxis sp.]
MNKTIAIFVAATAALAVAGCSSVPRNTGTSYECSSGTRLNVNYLRDGALVRVNGGMTMVLKSTPANRGEIYENKKGARLQRSGNGVTWNTALRSAPESCRAIATPL